MEFLLQLPSFQNVDIHKRGTYQIRVRLYAHTTPSDREFATLLTSEKNVAIQTGWYKGQPTLLVDPFYIQYERQSVQPRAVAHLVMKQLPRSSSYLFILDSLSSSTAPLSPMQRQRKVKIVLGTQDVLAGYPIHKLIDVRFEGTHLSRCHFIFTSWDTVVASKSIANPTSTHETEPVSTAKHFCHFDKTLMVWAAWKELHGMVAEDQLHSLALKDDLSRYRLLLLNIATFPARDVPLQADFRSYHHLLKQLATTASVLYPGPLGMKPFEQLPTFLIHDPRQSSHSISALTPTSFVLPIESMTSHIEQRLQEFDPNGGLPPLLSQEVHLIVFVHGLDGSSYDFRLFRNMFSLVPYTLKESIAKSQVYLLAKSNEKDSYQDVSTMGQNLAHEVEQAVQRHGASRISFISHSMGGLIVRAALTFPALGQFKDCMHAFVSLATPHLGMRYIENLALKQIMAIGRTFKKSNALLQLGLLDAVDPRQTYLYQLSLSTGLTWFQTVTLIASPHDRYVPFSSARLEMDSRALQDAVYGPIYVEMMNHLLMPISPTRLQRWSVGFDQHESTRDVLGRAAHIALLQDPHFIETFLVYGRWLLL